MKKYLALIIVFLVIANKSAYAIQSDIKINEVLLDPSQSIELYNKGIEDQDISGWFIDDSSGTTYFTVPPNTILPAQKCIVFTAAFSLNKSTPDIARLFNSVAAPTEQSNKLIDSYAYSASAGTGISFQRIPDGEPIWASAPASLEFRNLDNSICANLPSPTPTPTSIPTPTPTFQTATSISNIIISEVGVNPANGENEWVELYNNNDFPVTLDGWFIDDILAGGGSKVEFSKSISAHSYTMIEIESALFNNSGDEINLLDYSERLVDALSYSTSIKGYSIGRNDGLNASACVMQSTVLLSNSSCVEPTSVPTPTQIRVKNTTIPTTKPLVNAAAIKISPPPTHFISQQNVSKKSQKISNFKPTTGTIKNTNTPQNITITTDEPRKIARTLSFTSFSASVLTIISLLFKMKGE